MSSLVYLHPSLATDYKKTFKEFHDFTLSCGSPMGTILVSSRTICHKCERPLSVEQKKNMVVFYHINLGSYVSCRLTKVCRKCKIYEHYGYWTEKGSRYFDKDSLELKFLLSSEDTAFDICLLRECSSLLMVGAVPFSTYTASYNRRFGYHKGKVIVDKSKPKRMKR
ncbi:Hypothetical predicted protein [Paramuricea clavata]|uniref:Uncharacterized protein n=1 Tax=Paramuricea clavata TaxID=317549 RepID=A0A7D9EUC6_PARCT|nr:Hypothetical predicted protein [Paramuricea clavata]